MTKKQTIDAVVHRTATKITAAMDNMVKDLPEDAAPQAAIEMVVRRLTHDQPWFMALIWEDENVREAYYEELALRLATAAPDPHL